MDLVIETPEVRSEERLRAVRAVFSSFAKFPIKGNRTTMKSIYLAINLARNNATNPTAPKTTIRRLKIKLLEKKFPNQIMMRVERGKTTPSSLKVPAKVGTTKANIKTPITTIAERITP